MKILSKTIRITSLMSIPFFAMEACVGAQSLIPSGIIDLQADTITLPLQHGHLKDGRDVYYILTDTSDSNKAKDLGIVYSPLLAEVATAVLMPPRTSASTSSTAPAFSGTAALRA